MGGAVFLIDYTMGENSIKKNKMNVNQRQKKKRMGQRCPT
jgi:hypothetical protein